MADTLATVDLSTLSPPQKRRVWEWLKTHQPDLAALLQDPAFGVFRTTFDSTVHLPRAMVQEALDERS